MTPLPAALGGDTAVVAWRLDKTVHAGGWDTGEGSFRYAGRWNSKGVRAVYCSFDPATTILEAAVHKGFATLDSVPHTLTSLAITKPAVVHAITADELPNANWLRPGDPSAGQQGFGDDLLQKHPFIALPSVVSRNSWNLIFIAERAQGAYKLLAQERFALDTRLNPPAREAPAHRIAQP